MPRQEDFSSNPQEAAIPPSPAKSSNATVRRRHKKVKTGCNTCKVRRVKCDEERPSCLKCRSTGRQCDGYPGAAVPVSSSGKIRPSHSPSGIDSTSRISFAQNMTSLSIRNRLLDFPGTINEHRSIDFFYRQTAPILSGYFDAGFWTRMLPQIGCSEPCIQHAMIALASLQEHEELQDQIKGAQSDNFRFALTQYNKSIKLLNQRLSTESNTTIALIACVLFVCIEFLRGNLDGAASHIDGGVSVLHAEKQGGHSRASSEPQPVEASLRKLFQRLSIQNSLCGRAWSPMSVESTCATFSSLEDARSEITLLMHSAHGFIRSCLPQKLMPGTPPPTGSVEKRDSLLAQLSRWKLSMDALLSKRKSDSTRAESHASTVLSILHLISKIWIATSMELEEMAWDNHVQDFETIVTLSEELSGLHHGNKSINPVISTIPMLTERYTWRDRFTFEMGAMPAVYFSAVKCRHPLIRRRSIAVLTGMRPRREGLWDARHLAAVARRVIELEEIDETGYEISERPFPAEKNRVLDSRFGDSYYGGQRQQEVTFITRSGISSEDLTQRTEYIPWY